MDIRNFFRHEAETPCPHCGKRFKLLNGHITKKHAILRVEVRRGDDGWEARVLRNGDIISDWMTPCESYYERDDGELTCEWWTTDETKTGKWGEDIVITVVAKKYAAGEKCDGEVLLGQGKCVIAKRGGTDKHQHNAFGAVIVFVE
jgi:hypothetical protein